MHVRSSQIWGCQQGYISWDEAGLPPALHTGRPVQVMMGLVTSVCLQVGSRSVNCHPSASSLQKLTTGASLEPTQGLLLMGTQILLRPHLPGFSPSLKREADVNGLHQEDAASEDLLVMPLIGSSPGSFSSHQDKGTKSGQRGGPWATWGFGAP